MITRIVKQYKCEYCGKRGYQKPRMEKHEQGCTSNSDRRCGMCAYGGSGQSLSSLLKIVPNAYGIDTNDDVMRKLREASGNCPACILAVIKQSTGYTFPEKFDFAKECEEFWNEYNDDYFEDCEQEYVDMVMGL